MNHYETIYLNSDRFAHLNFNYTGHLGSKNKPPFAHKAFVMQSVFAIHHFYYCLN